MTKYTKKIGPVTVTRQDLGPSRIFLPGKEKKCLKKNLGDFFSRTGSRFLCTPENEKNIYFAHMCRSSFMRTPEKEKNVNLKNIFSTCMHKHTLARVCISFNLTQTRPL